MTTHTDPARAQEAMPEPDPCPFCKDPMLEFVPTEDGCGRGEKDQLFVCCDHCGAMGPAGATVLDAITAWNRRAAIQQAAVAVPEGYAQRVIDALYENSDPVSIDAAELLTQMLAAPEVNRDQVHSDSGGSSGVQVPLTDAPRAVKDDEQAIFEEWLARVRPSGDVESVQSQWEQSYEYSDFYYGSLPPVKETIVAYRNWNDQHACWEYHDADALPAGDWAKHRTLEPLYTAPTEGI